MVLKVLTRLNTGETIFMLVGRNQQAGGLFQDKAGRRRHDDRQNGTNTKENVTFVFHKNISMMYMSSVDFELVYFINYIYWGKNTNTVL